MTKHLTLLLFIGLAWGQPFNSPNEISLNADNLIGQWTFDELHLNMHLTSGVNQTISDYNQSMGYTPSQGVILISGAINGQMNYTNLRMVSWNQYYYGMTMLQISNNSISYGYESEDLEYPYYHFTYQLDGDSLECELNLTSIVEEDTISTIWYSNNVNESTVFIDTTSNVVEIDSLLLLNIDSIDSVLLSGQLTVDQIDVVAGESFTISYPYDVFLDYRDISWDFFGDSTGVRVFEQGGHHNYWWSDSVQFNWTATDDSIFIDDSSFSMLSFSYEILGDTLFFSNTYNSCEVAHYECDQHLDMMSSQFGIEDLQQVLNEEIRTYLNTNPLFVNDNNILPNNIVLQQNYPNPFNPITTLRYDIPQDINVNITIYDMTGRQVKTLINGFQTSGYKSIQWNATNNTGKPVSAGVYFYTIQAGDFVDTKKMILLK